MPLGDAIERSTVRSARKIKMEDKFGNLEEGAVGDMAIFDFEGGDFSFKDFFGNAIHTDRRLTPVQTFRKGLEMPPPQRKTETLSILNRTNPWKNYG
jgi:predicted amidohydrolase